MKNGLLYILIAIIIIQKQTDGQMIHRISDKPDNKIASLHVLAKT